TASGSATVPVSTASGSVTASESAVAPTSTALAGSTTVSGSVIASESAISSGSATVSGSAPAAASTVSGSATSASSAASATSTALIATKTTEASGSVSAAPTVVPTIAPTVAPSVYSSTSTSTSATIPLTTEQPTTTKAVAETTTAQALTSSTANADDWMPSSILIVGTTTTTTEPTGTATKAATTTTAAAQLPGSISPAGGIPNEPKNSTLIQIGFNGKLRYSFVATTPLSSSQIFTYVPQGLEYALSANGSDVVMYDIQPYDNSASTGYIATVALAYIPSGDVDTLSQMLHNPISKLYEQPNQTVKTLMSMIDPSIPLIVSAGSSSGGGSSGSSGSGSNKGSDDGGYDQSDAGTSSTGTTKASAVGIGVGAVAGAAAYGAGMFWVARRYRKKRQLHQRSPSAVDQMSEGRGSAALAAGGRISRGSQNSRGTGRTQMISAPVMAENSLGWN
ncbi:putative mucin family signaling protein Msb2, partial [Aspergillus brunneoviolaceus CBS 621.78]